ncbi:MAG: alpha-2-macroglobulin family protein, partial [Candidatus Aminicenantes bacterium]|nr:alpha-2-macroglobulin family protein [Candidatus Aminicenantes bacterium]
GTVRTDETGKFTIAFKAKPDPSVPASSQPVFTYQVTADVTDSAGETRSAEGSARVGYASLEAGLSGKDWQEQGKPVVLSITTTTLNGKRIASKGVVEIFPLRGPDKPVPADMIGEVSLREKEAQSGKSGSGFAQTSDWRKWPESAPVAKKEFETSLKEGTKCSVSFNLGQGAYKARLKTVDKAGTPVEDRLYFLVLDPAEARFPVKIPFHGSVRSDSVEVGQTFEMLWGTGYEKGPVLIEVLQNGKWLQRYWTTGAPTQGVLRVPVGEELRGGFTVAVSMVKENRLYRENRRVHVPWTNKSLDLKWKTFRSKLRPGQAETWSLQIKGSQAEMRAAEMVASLYDASLDQFYGHGFPGISGIFRSDTTYVRWGFSNRPEIFRGFTDNLNPYRSTLTPSYVHFPKAVEEDLFAFQYPGGMKTMARMDMPEAPAPTMAAAEKDMAVAGGVVGGVTGGVTSAVEKKAAPEVDLSQVQARKNLSETAFFYPHLLTDRDGTVTIEFKIPEALTRWRFLGFAHTKELQSGSLEGETVTQKELMVQPNPPRFLREGDALEFTVKVTNMADKEAAGAVELRFFDPKNDKSIDALLANKTQKHAFTIPAKQSRSFSWPVTVPDGLEIVGYKAVAAAAAFSDGEEGMFPVLSRTLLVRESIPLWISDKGEKKFTFEKLAKSGESTTLKHLGLTVQMASNPAWYAVQALPYLMEFPYECSEQVFNRLYANSLAQKISGSSPKIRKVFDLWKGTDALKSNLEKNEDLKSVLLQESPWVLEAKSETQAKWNIGLLFDENTMSRELKNAYSKLAQMQLADGSWPWFPGGPGNSYITLYIVTGFGRLKHLSVKFVAQDLAFKALEHLDNWIDSNYREILRLKSQDQNHLSPTIALYLYGRSFYLEERPIPPESREAVDYFLAQGAKYWLQLDNRQSQAHLALALNRFGDKETPPKIMRSMKERSRVDEELGRFWSELEFSWWWYRAPIETQAVMIEAFDEVMNDQKTVEECKIWLLKQKQTQDWKTTKATADAVYGLILRGTDLLASDAIVEVSLAGKTVQPEKVEAGTGFYEKRFAASEISPAMGAITVKKTDKGIAWGGVHWQYLEDISKITAHAQNPLRLKKSVFIQRLTKKGPVIEPVQGPLAVGDTLIVRIELRTDRDMEYVHMKDHRGSGLEPVNVLSRYKFQDGLAYYEATKDTATHFFIDYLPKGTYVFEYPLKVVHRGAYQNGMAHIECMYAPEFNSHSESVKLDVR